MIYVVGTEFSNVYTSTNNIQYCQMLNGAMDIPWYYAHYKYMLLSVDSIKIPCDADLLPIPRKELSVFDKKLYQLHVKAVKSWKQFEDFYWRVSPELAREFDQLWTSAKDKR